MRKATVGTVTQFLDEFERDVMSTFPFHKYTINRQKACASEFARNRCPGWLQLDVDFAENGAIITGRCCDGWGDGLPLQHHAQFRQSGRRA